MRTLRNLAASTALLLLCAPVSAHMIDDDEYPGNAKWRPERLRFMPTERVPHVTKPPLGIIGTQYIIVLPNKWAQGQTVRVCFVGGSDALRARILAMAALWFPHTNLTLDTGGPNGTTCAKGDTREVRIGFAEPGYWSYIGNESVDTRLTSKNLVSMNFQGFDVNAPAEPRFTGVVLHEWGHALGLHHEHQSPAAGCDKEYDWNKLYGFYKARYGWSASMVDDNVRQLMADRSAYDWSEADPLSIMIYASNPSFLINSTKSPCYFQENERLSALDAQGMERTYPKANPPVSLQLQATSLFAVLNKGLDPSLEQALARQHRLARKQMLLLTK
jgi:hypothetical protein